MNKSSISSLLPSLRSFIWGAAKQGDVIVVAAIGAVIAFAAFLFLTCIYASLSAPQTLMARQRPFNMQQFEKVVDRIEMRDERLNDRLSKIPRMPFKTTLQPSGE